MTTVLSVEHVAKRFGAVTALRDVNLRLEQDEVLGLIGDNGAGKSTLLKSSAASTGRTRGGSC
jgi:simple sugar transport system ATP-binding protein